MKINAVNNRLNRGSFRLTREVRQEFKNIAPILLFFQPTPALIFVFIPGI